jgi:hypothetical protein
MPKHRTTPARTRPLLTIELTPTVASYLKGDLEFMAQDLATAAGNGDLAEVLRITADIQHIAGKLTEFERSKRRAGVK